MSAGRPGVFALGLLLAAVTGGARAAEPGIEPVFALRAGWASSLGDAASNVPMSETVRAQIPLQLDLLLADGPFAAGAYASYGPGIAGGCLPGARCNASSYRIGAEATWTWSGLGVGIEPWMGAGVGYEWSRRESDRDGAELERYRGLELLSLQGGADLLVHRHMGFGPFVLVSIGRYAHYSLDTPVESSSREIAGKSLHAWLEIGIRGRFVPWSSP